MVLEKNSLTLVLILIHNGAPHDTKIYKEVLENLKQSRIIRPLDILLFDKGYFSYENYRVGIIEYRIIPLIFPRENYNKNKLLNPIICSLGYFKNKKENLKIRREIKLAIILLLKKLKEWKKYKPIRCYIEDFFKVCKQAFNIHKNTQIYTRIIHKRHTSRRII